MIYRTTGIGSLPFLQIKTALEHVFSGYDVPFFPQLPVSRAAASQRHSLPPMALEVLNDEMLRVLATGDGTHFCDLLNAQAADPQYAADLLQRRLGWDEFCQRGQAHTHLKMQLIGPCSLSQALKPTLRLPALAIMTTLAPSAQLEQACWAWIEALSRAAISQLKHSKLEQLYLFWDDFFLLSPAAMHDQQIRERLANAQRVCVSLGATLGIHSCASWDSTQVLPMLPALAIACDFTLHNPLTAEHIWIEFMQRGGSFAIGCIDTQKDQINIPQLNLLWRDVQRSLSQAIARQDLQPPLDLLVTGGCGTGLKTEAFERELAKTLRGLTRAGLP